MKKTLQKLIVNTLFISCALISTNIVLGANIPPPPIVPQPSIPAQPYVPQPSIPAQPYVPQPSIPAQPNKDNKDWQPPTPEEEALEEPLIDPIDIFSLFGGIFSSLFKASEKVAVKATEKFVYHYFKDTTGEITESILKKGVRASTGFKNTLGYEGKVFVSEISPDKISRVNLNSYGVGNANSYVKIALKKNDLVIPAQNIYFGEKGARIVGAKSGLYEIGTDGAKYLNRKVIVESGSLAPYKANINSFVNNLIDAPRCLTAYWLVGGGVALDINLISNKK